MGKNEIPIFTEEEKAKFKPIPIFTEEEKAQFDPHTFAPRSDNKDRSIISYIQRGAEGIDSITGGPTRSAAMALIEKKDPVEAYKRDFGIPGVSPTGRDIALKIGVPDVKKKEGYALGGVGGGVSSLFTLLGGEKSPADVAGTAIDIALDPTNLASPVFRLLKPGAKIIGESLVSGAKAIGRGAARVGEAITGIPAETIKFYASEKPAYNALIKESAGNPQLAADIIREGYQKDIQAAKSALNEQIASAIDKAPGNKSLPIAPVIQSMDKIKGMVNEKLQPEVLANIKGIENRLKQLAGKSGLVSPKEMQQTTSFLQDLASGSYGNGTDLFQRGTKLEQAARDAAATAREVRNVAIPGAANAYKKLEELHKIDDLINKNLVTPGKPEASLIAAGSSGSSRQRAQLEALGKLSSKDFVKDAEALATMRYFQEPSLVPIDQTGKSATRLMTAAGTGFVLGNLLGLEPKTAATVAASLTSPLALKTAIDTGRIPIEGVRNIIGKQIGTLTPGDYQRAFLAIKSAQQVSIQNKNKEGNK